MSSPAPEDDVAAQVRARWQAANDRVTAAARAAKRDPAEVAVLLACKTMSAEVIRAAVLAGAPLLGQNKVQELVTTAPALLDLAPTWHLIGPLQTNKVNAALRWVSAVESVADLDLAARLSRRCEATDRDLDVWVQVNVSGEVTKHGATPHAALDLACEVAALPRLHLAGLMTVGARSDDPELVRTGYARLRGLRDDVVRSGAPGTAGAVGLSMGMSGDLELAVAEGATVVRLGSAVFGPRA